MNRPVQRDPDSTDSYTVAWICALEEEYLCACRMLDEEFNGPETSEDSDDNLYVYGRIAKHYVVIGCLPAGRYGTNSAARVARDMVRTFPHLRFALMVGIGGGAPTPRNDIRLGDVVVSQPKEGSGGVIQYDLGKLEDGRFQKTGQLNAPPEKLLGVIPEMRRLHNDKKKPDRLAEHLQRLDDMEDYQRPSVDRLYTTDYLHVDGDNCSECDLHSVVDRPERQNHRALYVHYGNIASGNSVLKNAIVRDTLAKDLDILCFEMEAAGLMNNVPCLVIRGICDYCDSHKNDDWHKYAALAAATYARELLLILRPQRVDTMPPWAERVAQELRQVGQELIRVNDTQRIVLTTIECVNQKIDWGKLPAVQEAAADSFANQHEDECLPGTRTSLLNEIGEWAVSPHGKCIFWLSGMAGTGKSTISRTVAKMFKETKNFGAGYFFKRGEEDQGNAKKFFPTLIRQLMLRISELRSGVQDTIHNDPDIASKSLREQFEKLLLQPLLNLDQLGRQPQAIVIVIDALDECEYDQDVRSIIRLLPLLQKVKAVRLRIFLTSRPELPISLGFLEIANHEYQDLALHKIPEEMTKHDIYLFLQDRFAKIKHERNISQDWPSDNVIQELVTMSVPLFISAATICRYIENSKLEPKLRLAELLTDQAKYVSRMDKTYLPILTRLLDDQKSDESEQQQLLQEFHNIVGVIILLAVPLSINTLSLFLGIGADQISNRLDSFRSVLSISGDRDQPVRILHLSFRDFLVQSRNKFRVDEPKKHKDIAKSCLKTMRSRLQKDICNLGSPGTHRTDIDSQHIRQHLPLELQYSCRYWIHHLERSHDLSSEIEEVRLFFQKHFLHWVEVMSLLGLVSEVVGMLNLLHTVIPGDDASILANFLHDAKRFVRKCRQIADEAPLQIYCAGLVFAPHTAIIRAEFNQDLPSWICQLPQVNENWGAELQTLEGHSDWVCSVAFSPDGRLLASGSDDGTVRLWDPATGALEQTLKGYSGSVFSVAFSPNGQMLASGSDDVTVRLWDLATGSLEQALESYSDSVCSVAFSPNGRLLASGSKNGAVQLWDPATGALEQTLKGYSNSVCSVAFSPDGRLLAFGSKNGTVQLWETATDALKQTLKGHSDSVRSVDFSPDGRLLASGSDDATVRLWDSATGALEQTLEGHSGSSVAFSPDGRLLASSSYDGIVRLWDLATGSLEQTLEGHSESVCSVDFSPDGRLLASGSIDKTVRLWDPAIGALKQTFKRYSDSVRSVDFSPNGRLPVSGSDDNGSDDDGSDNDSSDDDSSDDDGSDQTHKGHSSAVYLVAFSPDGRLLASGSYDATVRLWDPVTGALEQTLKKHPLFICSVAFSPDGRLLASGSINSTVQLWETATGALIQTLKGHSGSVYSVAFSPDGRLLASGSDDATVRLWDPATGALKQTLKGHSDSVRSVDFSPDGRLPASGSDDDGSDDDGSDDDGSDDDSSDDDGSDDDSSDDDGSDQTHEGYLGSVCSVAFSPDGRLLASGSHDDTVRLWDPVTGSLEQTLEGHSGSGCSVAFSPDSRLLASCSDDGTVRLWDLATGVLEETLRTEGTVTKLNFGRTDGTVTKLEFSQDGSYLNTNVGSFNIQSRCGNPVYNSPNTNPEIFIQSGEWIAFNGKQVLWLPPEARPCGSAIKSNTLALGHASGRISFIGFRV